MALSSTRSLNALIAGTRSDAAFVVDSVSQDMPCLELQSRICAVIGCDPAAFLLLNVTEEPLPLFDPRLSSHHLSDIINEISFPQAQDISKVIPCKPLDLNGLVSKEFPTVFNPPPPTTTTTTSPNPGIKHQQSSSTCIQILITIDRSFTNPSPQPTTTTTTPTPNVNRTSIITRLDQQLPPPSYTSAQINRPLPPNVLRDGGVVFVSGRLGLEPSPDQQEQLPSANAGFDEEAKVRVLMRDGKDLTGGTAGVRKQDKNKAKAVSNLDKVAVEMMNHDPLQALHAHQLVDAAGKEQALNEVYEATTSRKDTTGAVSLLTTKVLHQPSKKPKKNTPRSRWILYLVAIAIVIVLCGVIGVVAFFVVSKSSSTSAPAPNSTNTTPFPTSSPSATSSTTSSTTTTTVPAIPSNLTPFVITDSQGNCLNPQQSPLTACTPATTSKTLQFYQDPAASHFVWAKDTSQCLVASQQGSQSGVVSLGLATCNDSPTVLALHLNGSVLTANTSSQQYCLTEVASDSGFGVDLENCVSGTSPQQSVWKLIPVR